MRMPSKTLIAALALAGTALTTLPALALGVGGSSHAGAGVGMNGSGAGMSGSANGLNSTASINAGTELNGNVTGTGGYSGYGSTISASDTSANVNNTGNVNAGGPLHRRHLGTMTNDTVNLHTGASTNMDVPAANAATHTGAGASLAHY